jgi:hypothetical protein
MSKKSVYWEWRFYEPYRNGDNKKEQAFYFLSFFLFLNIFSFLSSIFFIIFFLPVLHHFLFFLFSSFLSSIFLFVSTFPSPRPPNSSFLSPTYFSGLPLSSHSSLSRPALLSIEFVTHFYKEMTVFSNVALCIKLPGVSEVLTAFIAPIMEAVSASDTAVNFYFFPY